MIDRRQSNRSHQCLWRRICASCAVMLLLPAAVQAQLLFTTNNGAITITGFTGSPTIIFIPSATNGYPVTSIGDGAFFDCTSLTSVMIPDSVTNIRVEAFYGCSRLPNVTIGNSVTSIGSYAFEQCSSLASVTIPKSVTRIGDWAFSGCGLTSVTVPNSVTSIGDGAFAACTRLTNIAVNVSNPNYSSLDGVLFDETQTTLIQFPGGLVGSYTIPMNVTSIENAAFNGCTSLTSVTIPNSVISMGENAFAGCSSLASVMIPNSVTSIGSYAFLNCTSLTSVTIPDSVTTIGDFVFTGCTSLTSVTIPNSVTSIGYEAFEECTSLTSVAIPDSVTNIGGAAFEGCSGLRKVTIPDSVTFIASVAFEYCTSLTSVTIPNSVTSIGSYAFLNCYSLTSVTIPNSVTNIGSYAFEYCTSLKTVYFEGNAPAPSNDSSVFQLDSATVYYLPGTGGWGSTFDGRPTALWVLASPSASNITAATLQNQPLNLALAKVLALAADPNGLSLSVTSVSATSTNGGSVLLGQDQVTFTPVPGYIGTDRFSYTVSDAAGASASAYVFVQVLATNQVSGNMLPLSAVSGGYVVSFAGIPGRAYSVQRAATITGPWVTIGTVMVQLNGIGAIQDTNSLAGTAFYRTTYP